MKRNGQIIAEQALRIVELEKELASTQKRLDWKGEYLHEERLRQTGRLSAMRGQVRQLQEQNSRLQAKLALRSRKLGEARKQADQWHTAWEDAERALRAATGETTQAPDAVTTGEGAVLQRENELLRRLALIHFTHDEIAREMDGVKA